MTRALGKSLIAFGLLTTAAAAPAGTYYVRPGGSDSCAGTADADAAGAGTTCAFRTIEKCDAALAAGDTCTVSSGTFAETLRPARSGSATAKLVYACPSRACVVRPASGDALNLDGRSHVTVDGFVFEGRVVPWNNGSTGNTVRNFAVRGVGGAAPFFEVNAGCGTDNRLDGFSISAPRDTLISPLVIGVNCVAPARDRRSTFRKGTIRGGRNAIQLDNCDDCVLDEMRVMHAWNHTFTVGGDTANLTVRNSLFYATTSFRETIPDVRSVHGLTFVNNAVVFALNLPGYNVPAVADGRVTVRNNVFFNYGTGSSEGLLWMNDANTVSWDIDYNAYVGGGNFTGGAPFWRDLRNGGTAAFYPDVDGDGILGTASGSQDFDDWQKRGRNPDGSNWDQHSVVIADTDYRRSTASYGRSVWGTTAPTWGAVVQCTTGEAFSFETHGQWGEAMAPGDLLEYEFDGTLRTVTSVTTSSCGRRVVFTPALPVPVASNAWFFSWGRQDADGDGTPSMTGHVTAANRDGWKPVTGSALIDGGDPALCPRTVKGLRCDIGPVEVDAAPPDAVAPTAPSNLVATGTIETIDLTWTAATDNVGVTSYEISRSAVSGSGYAPVGVSSSTRWSDADADAGATWYYRVRAADAAGNRSADSNEAWGRIVPDTQAPTNPAGLSATSGATAVALAWTASSDDLAVAGYDVLRSTSAGAGFTTIATTATPGWTDATGSAGAMYFYRVRGFDAAGNRSGDSNEASTRYPDPMAPTAPTGLSATSGVLQVDLAWTASTDNVGVTAYTVQRSLTFVSGYAPVGTTASTSWKDSAVTAGTVYYYQVYASDAAGNTSGGSNRSSARPSSPPDAEPPTAPANLSAASGVSTVGLSWTPSSDNTGVDRYDVLRSGTPGTGFAKIGETDSTAWTDATGTGGTRYYYRVRAADTAGNASGDSNEASALFPTVADTQPPSAPASLTATPNVDRVELAWQAATDNVGVTSYRVSRSVTPGAGFAPVMTTGSTAWTDRSVAAGTTYYYRVAAQDGASNFSPESNEASATPGGGDLTAPTVPAAPRGTSRPGSAHLEWTASTDASGVTGYEILRSNRSGGPYTLVGIETTTSWDDAGAPSGVLSAYVVRAVDAAGNRSALSLEVQTGRSVLVAVSSVPVSGSIGVPWDAAPQVRLSEPVQSRTISTTNVRLVQEDTGAPVALAPGSPRLESDGMTITFVTSGPLYAATSYRIEVLTGAKALRSIDGNVRLTASFQASFLTAASGTPTAAPFQAESLVPTDGATGVSTDTALNVTFLSAVDPASVTRKRVKLVGPTGTVRLAPVPVFHPDGKTITWSPLRPLAASTSYQIQLKGGRKGLRGTNGQPMPEGLVITFTTADVAAGAALEVGVAN